MDQEKKWRGRPDISLIHNGPHGNVHHSLTDKQNRGIHRVRTRELWFLTILDPQNLTEVDEKFLVGLAGILSESSSESMTHGSGCTPSFMRVRTCLRIFTSTPRNHISWRRPRRLSDFFCLLCSTGSSLNQSHSRLEDTSHIALRVGGGRRKKDLGQLQLPSWVP